MLVEKLIPIIHSIENIVAMTEIININSAPFLATGLLTHCFDANFLKRSYNEALLSLIDAEGKA